MNAASQRAYRSAPIVEAVLDLRVEGVPPEGASRLRSYRHPSYPIVEQSEFTTTQVRSNPLGVDAQVHREVDGIRLTSTGGSQVVQMRTNGYTFSQLAPYSGWTTFFADGKRVWRDYCEVASPALATRAGLRYINRIVLPEGDARLDRYLRTRPEISSDMPTTTTGFFLTLDIPMAVYGCTARVMQTILQAEDGSPPGAAVMLDIDVFSTISLAGSAMQDQLDELFQRLRTAKNLVFEASITDATRGLFS